MNKKLVAFAALVCAGLASACCLGPLIVAGLGLSGLALAAGLARHRPLFLALTAMTLTAGFYLAYRKRDACADEACQTGSNSRMTRTALWLVTAAALAMATFPNWSASLLARKAATVPRDAQTLSLRIAGMDCAACAVSIEKSVEKVPGVYAARVDFDRAQATVVTDGKTSPEAVLQAVKAAGYQATILNGASHGQSKS